MDSKMCDKCGEPVHPANDAVMLDLYLGHLGTAMLFAQPRHLLPTETCPGSPSRAQYIEGQPRDERSEYAYDQKSEKPIRDAYQVIQERYAALK